VLLLSAISGCSSGDVAPAEVEPLSSGSVRAPESLAPSAGAITPQPRQGLDSPTPTTQPSTSEEAASAFTRRFFEVVNEAYLKRDAADVRRLSTSACGSCAAVANDVDRLAEVGHVVAGRRYVVSSAEAAPARADGQVVVDFRFDADPYVERNAIGTVVQRFPGQAAQDGQVLVTTASGAWQIAAIRLVNQ